MKITKSIFLRFDDFKSNTNAYINVNFDVSHVHCRSISYQRSNTGLSQVAKYGVLTSDLVENDPLGVFFNDSTYSTSPGTYSTHEFRTPKKISGMYNFQIYYADGTPLTPVHNPDYIILILEFSNDITKYD